MSDAAQDAGTVRALAPFGSRAFRWLWTGVALSSVGSWAQTVGAQWLFIDDPNAATIVSLVQTATTLPMLLFGLVAGVLADAFDRRRLMLFVQVYFVVVAVLLARPDLARPHAAAAAAGVHVRDRRRATRCSSPPGSR